MRSGFVLVTCFSLISLAADAAPIHEAAKKGDLAGIEAALSEGADINDVGGPATPLYHAVRRGHLDAAKLLIERGADVNLGDKGLGVSPLMAAVAKDKIDLIELLIANGADPSIRSQGEAALHVAAKRGCLACVEALVEAGADVNARTTDEHDRTPLHLARLLGHADVSEYLLAHGVVAPAPASILDKLRAGDTDRGRVAFARCMGCHANEAGKGRKMGPNLWGVVGRPKASEANMSYSKALREWGGVWSYDDLNRFLSGPTLIAPGTLMEIRGIGDAERIDLIAYLRTLSESPMPLP
jgi:cytochrome c